MHRMSFALLEEFPKLRGNNVYGEVQQPSHIEPRPTDLAAAFIIAATQNFGRWAR